MKGYSFADAVGAGSRPLCRFAFTVALLFICPGISFAQDLMSGVYRGGGSNGENLRVIVDGRSAGIFIEAVGCLGSVEGYLVRNRIGDLFLVSSDYEDDGCAIGIQPYGRFSFSTEAGPECSALHGASCGFDGFVERVQ